ncbi:MAG: YigZ family protein [Gemmatimonadota bacterium]|nr:YigZ family protein [Gemmatimonadota bacterium]MDH3423386.1 YigZ family protein [Gemmatimonadota bacterium]
MADASRYLVPARLNRVELVVQRSRFVTTAARAADAEAAQAFVARVREEFPDATHHCWAFVAGPPGSSAQVGMSDDGEPHGTAGRPMLTTLLHGGVGEIVAVCTRYFGGIKLGTGGLSRAYSGAVKQILETLPTVERVERVSLRVLLAYGDVDAFRRLAQNADIVVEKETFGVDVSFVVGVPSTERMSFESALADLTQGRGRIEIS